MKQFLRYQISGMVFIAWVLIFYYSGISSGFDNFLVKIIDGALFKNKFLYTFIAALPIGVIIHQLSVSIKNQIMSGICEDLSDMPEKKYLIKLKKREKRWTKKEIDHIEYTKYILDRISNLNSFYYVRFDNGFLAPFLALIFVVALGYRVEPIAVCISVGLGGILLSYLPRICEEMKTYKEML